MQVEEIDVTEELFGQAKPSGVQVVEEDVTDAIFGEGGVGDTITQDLVAPALGADISPMPRQEPQLPTAPSDQFIPPTTAEGQPWQPSDALSPWFREGPGAEVAKTVVATAGAMMTLPVSGLVGLGALVYGAVGENPDLVESRDRAQRWAEWVQTLPMRVMGDPKYMWIVAWPFEKVHQVSKFVGDEFYEATGDPNIAAGMATVVEFGLAAGVFKFGGKGTGKLMSLSRKMKSRTGREPKLTEADRLTIQQQVDEVLARGISEAGPEGLSAEATKLKAMVREWMKQYDKSAEVPGGKSFGAMKELTDAYMNRPKTYMGKYHTYSIKDIIRTPEILRSEGPPKIPVEALPTIDQFFTMPLEARKLLLAQEWFRARYVRAAEAGKLPTSGIELLPKAKYPHPVPTPSDPLNIPRRRPPERVLELAEAELGTVNPKEFWKLVEELDSHEQARLKQYIKEKQQELELVRRELVEAEMGTTLLQEEPSITMDMLGTQTGFNAFKQMLDATAVDKFRTYLTSIGREVADYVKGSLNPAKRQVPTIPGTKPIPLKDLDALPISPHHNYSRVFGPFDNPAFDGAESFMAYVRNLELGRQWRVDVLRQIPDASKAIKERMGEVFNQYKPVLMYGTELANEIKGLTEGLQKYAKTSPQYAKAQTDLGVAKQRLKAVRMLMKPFLQEQSRQTFKSMQQYKDARIAVYAEGGLKKVRPGQYRFKQDPVNATINLSPDEIKIGDAIVKYMQQTRDALNAVGIKTLQKKQYMTHLWREFGDDKGVMKLSYKFRTTPSVLNFMGRVGGSRMWLPSTHAILKAYIPIAERKIAYQPLLNRWNIDKNLGGLPNYPGLRKYLNEWLTRNTERVEMTSPEKLLNMYVGLEYLRLIGFSASVGVKHATKVSGTLASTGFIPTVKGAALLTKAPVQAALKKAGIKGKHNELRVVNSFVAGRNIVGMLDEFPLLGSEQMVRSLLRRARTLTAQPTVAIEWLDHGTSVLATIVKAQNKGVSYATAHRAIWETIMDVNFWGRAVDMPMWQRNVVARALSMFQMTPWKLAELKGKFLHGTFADWPKVPKIAVGSDPIDIKLKLIGDALAGRKDILGTPMGAKLVRYAMVVGAAETVARTFDTTLWDMFMHLPWVQHFMFTKKDSPFFGVQMPQIGAAPPVQLMVEMGKTDVKQALMKEMKWLGQFSKFWRTHVKGQRPPLKYDSVLKYHLGLKRVGSGKHVEPGGGDSGGGFGDIGGF